MISRKLAWVVAAGVALVSCQQARTADPDREQALEKRVSELERALAASPAPAASPAAAPVAKPAPEPRPRAAHKPAPAGEAPAAPPVATAGARPASGDAPAPEDRPEPRRELPRVVIPAGTRLSLVLETPLSSLDSRPGERVTARVQRAEAPDGARLPGGAVLHGSVVEAERAGRVQGRARLVVAFDEIVVRGRTYGLDADRLRLEGEDSHGRDAKMIGGGALAGGVIGALLGGKGGFGKGVLIGAGAGSGTVLATRGPEVDLPSGAPLHVTLRSRLVL